MNIVIDLFTIYSAYLFCVANRTYLGSYVDDQGVSRINDQNLNALYLSPLFSNMVLLSLNYFVKALVGA